jgi:DNA polymerase sigma
MECYCVNGDGRELRILKNNNQRINVLLVNKVYFYGLFGYSDITFTESKWTGGDVLRLLVVEYVL